MTIGIHPHIRELGALQFSDIANGLAYKSGVLSPLEKSLFNYTRART
jgi:hypothetical protein